jgi:dienelactone hydrolase
VVSFHGLLTTQRPAAPGAVRAKVLVCNGDADPLVPRAQVAAFQEEMTAAGADWQVINYGGALHAFTNPNVVGSDNPALAYDPAADRQSWAAMRAFLDEAIGPVEVARRDDQARLPRCRRHALAQ